MYIFWLVRFRLRFAPTNFFFPKIFLRNEKSCDSLRSRRKISTRNFRERRSGEQVCPTLSPNAFVKSTIYHFRFPPGGGRVEDLEEGSRRRRSLAWPEGRGSWNNRVFAPRPSPVGNGSTLGRLRLVELGPKGRPFSSPS